MAETMLARALRSLRSPHEPTSSDGRPWIDLTESDGLTFELLDDTASWRERLVHEIVLHDSDHVRSITNYQVRLPLDVVRRYHAAVSPGDQVRVLLPFCVRPKSLVLGFGLSGPGDTPVTLLPREATAALQARYLARLAGQADAPGRLDLWEAISRYTPSAWREQLARTPKRGWWLGPQDPRERQSRALRDYLCSGLDLPASPATEAAIDVQAVRRWLEQLAPARTSLLQALGEPAEPDSASECVLLALPFLGVLPADVTAIDTVVGDFVEAVAAMGAAGREVLAEYGRRWEAVVDVVLPVGQPCTVRAVEHRPWVGAPSPVLRQDLPFGDACTTHLEIRTADHGVVIDRPAIQDLTGKRMGFAVGDAMRSTADSVAIYASGSDRPYFATVSVRVRVRASERMLVWWLFGLITLAAAVAVVLPEGGSLVDALALLTFPLTLAGAVVLARASTPLAERLLRRSRALLAGSVAMLWLVTLGRLLLNADLAWAESTWARITPW